MKFLKIALLSIFVLTAFFSTKTSLANNIPGLEDPIVVTTIPEYPAPNTDVKVKINSFDIDLNGSLIVWKINDKEVKKGIGEKELIINSGPNGTIKFIDISATVLNIGTFTKSFVIRPTSVGLVWESGTYTPPFYKGRSLNSNSSFFKVVALPEFISLDGKKIDPKSLIYKWSKNGKVESAYSGFGKNIFITSHTSYIKEGEDISVEVTSPNLAISGWAYITVEPQETKTILYEKSNLYGIMYEKALSNSFELKNPEITVVAEPYFFSTDSRESDFMEYTWKINNTEIPDYKNSSSITLRKNGTSGSSRLSLDIQNIRKVLQGSTNNLFISYE